MNKGRIHRELRYFLCILWNSIKSDDEMTREIKDLYIFRKITQNWIHRIKNRKILIKICGEIDKQSLERNSDCEEGENWNVKQNWLNFYLKNTLISVRI